MSSDSAEALVELEAGFLAAASVRCQYPAKDEKGGSDALVLATKLGKVVIQHQLVVVRVPFVAVGLGSKCFESDLRVLPLGDERRAESVEHLVRGEFEVGSLQKRKLDNV